MGKSEAPIPGPMSSTMKRILITIPFLFFCLSSCEDKTPDQNADPVVDRRSEKVALKLERLAAYDSSRQELSPQEQPGLDAVDARLRTLFSMIDRQDLSGLPALVDPEKGVHVDLKAHRSVDELKQDLADPQGYFEKFYLNSKLLRESTGDDSQVSLHELLNKNSRVFTEYYLEPGGKQIEVRFRLGSTPNESYRVNNAVLIKRDGEWYFLQLL